MVNDPKANIDSNTKEQLKWCSVPLSDVVFQGNRLEASIYDIEARQAHQQIETGRYPLTTIGGKDGLATCYVGARFKRIWVEKSDFPIYQPSAIADIRPQPDGYISHLTKTNIEALRVKRGQLLMTCSGTIGKVSYVSDTLDNRIFSHDLLRIDCKQVTDQGYVYTYLKSKLGNRILLSNSYGAVITHIEPEHLEKVPIPNAPEELKRKIHDLIVHSYNLRDESNELLDEAASLFQEELCLPDVDDFIGTLNSQESSVNTFNVKLSNLAGRMDASYHLPIVEAIISHFHKYAAEVTAVGDGRISREVILPPRFARVYVEQGHGRVLIGGKQIHELDPSGKKYLSKVKHTDLMDELAIHKNTSLITRSGTVGKVALVPQHWEQWIPSDHIIRVVPANDDIAGYLNVFLSSDYGHQLITHFTYGSVVDEIDETHVRQIAVPLLKNKEIQSKINTLALLANEKRYEAYELEQRALEIMEEEVINAR